MKSLPLAPILGLVVAGCVYIPPPPGSEPPTAMGATDPAPAGAAASAPQDPAAADAPWGTDEAPSAEAGAEATATATVAPPAAGPPAGSAKDGASAAAVCTRASTCTTAVSMEVCGMFNPKCLDAFHKHVDGATKDKCQAKLDRLPGLVEKWSKPGYKLSPDCK